MILQALVKHYENLGEEGKVSKEDGAVPKFLMESNCQRRDR